MHGVVKLPREVFLDYVSVLPPAYRAWAQFRLEHDASPSQSDITLSDNEFKCLKEQVASVVSPPVPQDKPSISKRILASVAENIFGTLQQPKKSEEFTPDRARAAQVLTEINRLVVH